jgi:ATP-dependent DNA helicase RecG
LGRRAVGADLKQVVLALCAWQPLSVERLATILGRNRHYLLTTQLRPMIRDGDLVYVHPNQPAHPQQAYTVPAKRGKK